MLLQRAKNQDENPVFYPRTEKSILVLGTSVKTEQETEEMLEKKRSNMSSNTSVESELAMFIF
ncbi:MULTISPECIES: hypothetical protein [unclassified Ruminococcus]|uniref:hypothetical protein n=1 Tax=unclassified Ruminococcus TaxID=2608920 RepID=UPI000A7900A1|nr:MULTISPECIES: hypothetical protein [unclassified Ruminococcus]